jgi:histidinol-phosphate/aromatic aminotransferase/cobyric acid decarboxylase-like protein
MVLGNAKAIDAILKVKTIWTVVCFRIQKNNCCAEQWQILVWFDEWNLQKTPRFDEQLAEKLGCKVHKEGVGLFVWAKLPEGSVSAEKFIDQILQEKSIL